MHEISFGITLRDYLTGEEIEETTYEEFRQALAKLLVEERGYPREALTPRVGLDYEVDGECYSRSLDLVAVGPEGRPVLAVLFCPGKVGSFERETRVAAQLLPGGPAPLALVTDTRDALLLDVGSGEALREGMRAIPCWDELLQLAGAVRVPALTPERRVKLTRIFHAYCGFLAGTCCDAPGCGPAPRKKPSEPGLGSNFGSN